MRNLSFREFNSLLQQDKIELTEDIRVKNTFTTKIIKFFTNFPSEFSGKFEGNGHTIYNPPIQLYDVILEDACIQNVTFEFDTCVSVPTAILTNLNYGTLSNITIKNSNFSNIKSQSVFVGINHGKIIDCTQEGGFTISDNDSSNGVFAKTNTNLIQDCVVQYGSLYTERPSGLVGQISERYTSDIGGISGLNNGTIKSCTVTSVRIKGTSNIGGISGTNNGTISDCTADNLQIYKQNKFIKKIGGIVGENRGVESSIHQSVTKNSNVLGDSMTGGIVGENNGTVADTICRYTQVDGEKYTGGICGVNVKGNITSCFSKSNIYGEQEVGGLVGRLDNGSVKDSVSDTHIDWRSKTNSGCLIGYVEPNCVVENCYHISFNRLGLIGNRPDENFPLIQKKPELSKKEVYSLTLI